MAFDAFSSPLSSSPDPLAMSPDATSRRSRTRTPRKTSYAPSHASSNTLQLQDFIMTPQSAGRRGPSSSPARSVVTGENQLSPWRIRVTVQAEREDERSATASDSPSRAHPPTMRTTTQTIPLKGLDSSPPPPKRRGRPARKTDVSPLKIQRAGTPGPRRLGRRRTVGGEIDGDKEDDLDFTPTPRRGRGRPRKDGTPKKATLKLMRASTPGAGGKEGEAVASGGDQELAPGVTKRRGRRKSSAPIQIAVDPDVQAEEPAELEVEHRQSRPLRDIGLNQASSSTDVLSPFDKEEYDDEDDADVFLTKLHRSVRPSGRMPTATSPTVITEASASEIRSIKLSSRGGGSAGNFYDHGAEDSVLESEGFSMVSIDSLRAPMGHSRSPTPQPHDGDAATVQTHSVDDDSQHGEASQSRAAPLRLSDSATELASAESPDSRGSSDRSVSVERPSGTSVASGVDQSGPRREAREGTPHVSTGPAESSGVQDMSSSPPARILSYPSRRPGRPKQQTPSIVFSSPSLPPPPAQVNARQKSNRPSLAITSQPSQGEPELGRAVEAAAALQGAVRASGPLGSPFTSPAKARKSTPQTDALGLFDGFGPGTRRELRAGWKLGEELARKQQEESARRVGVLRADFTQEQDVFRNLADERSRSGQADYKLGLPGKDLDLAAQQQQASPPTTVEDVVQEEEMSWQVDTPVRVFNETVNKPLPPDGPSEWLKQVREQQQAVIREAGAAPRSQVVVIPDETIAFSDDATESLEGSSVLRLRERSNATEEDVEELAEHVPLEDPTGDVTDVWLAEAQSSSVCEAPSGVGDKARHIFAPEELVKPPRSKIPSPWRKNGQMVYSDEVQEDDCIRVPAQTKQPVAEEKRPSPVQMRRPVTMEAESSHEECSRPNEGFKFSDAKARTSFLIGDQQKKDVNPAPALSTAPASTESSDGPYHEPEAQVAETATPREDAAPAPTSMPPPPTAYTTIKATPSTTLVENGPALKYGFPKTTHPILSSTATYEYHYDPASAPSLSTTDNLWTPAHSATLRYLYEQTPPETRGVMVPCPTPKEYLPLVLYKRPQTQATPTLNLFGLFSSAKEQKKTLLNHLLYTNERCMVISPCEVSVIGAFVERVKKENEGREVWTEKEVAVMLMWGLEREIKYRAGKDKRARERRERRDERARIRLAREQAKMQREMVVGEYLKSSREA